MIASHPTDLALDWDLSELYQSFDDPQFIQDIAIVQQKASDFQAAYRGKVAQLTPPEINNALQELETIASLNDKLYYYPMLRFSANTRDYEAQQKLDQVQEVATEVENQVLFFNLELQQLPTATFAGLQKHQALQNYSRYLESLAELRPYQLPENVEQVLNEAVLTGRDAWIQLREVHIGSQTYPTVTTPEGHTGNIEAELASLLFHPHPQVRLDAYHSVRQVLKTHNTLYGYILNILAQDYRLEAERRGYSSTLHKQLLAHEVPVSVFEAVMEGTRERYDLFQRYYRLKGRVLGSSIRICDVYAPWGDTAAQISYTDGIAILNQALENFSPEYARQAQIFLRERWVDARVRPGKRRGGFCAYVSGLHSYLMLSYTNNYKSLFTLAHELGHGLHYVQIQKHQSHFNSNVPIMLAEIASIFNEFLLLDYLLKQSNDTTFVRGLLTECLEDNLNLLFRQSTISRLELIIHQHATEGSFDSEFINKEWFRVYQELCDDAVLLLPEHRYDWAKMEHIFLHPFYCYNYTLSFVVALACYQQYKERGKEFIPEYLNLLALGSSQSATQALQAVGIDITHPATISQALTYTEELLKQLEKYWEC